VRQEIRDAMIPEVFAMIERGELTAEEIDEVLPIIDAINERFARAAGVHVHRGRRRTKKRRR
jgi:hypothetical protein